jgi:hypothetical protein
VRRNFFVQVFKIEQRRPGQIFYLARVQRPAQGFVAMPRHYFHLQNGVTTLDREGVDVPDMAATRAEAVKTIGTMLCEDPMDTFWDGKPLRVWVTEGPDGTGKTLFALQIVQEQI